MKVIGTITKDADERRSVPIDYYGRLPAIDDLTIQSSTLTAVRTDDQSDATNVVLNSGSGTLVGHRLRVPVKAGVPGKTYRIKVQLDLSDGFNRPIDYFDLVIE